MIRVSAEVAEGTNTKVQWTPRMKWSIVGL